MAFPIEAAWVSFCIMKIEPLVGSPGRWSPWGRSQSPRRTAGDSEGVAKAWLRCLDRRQRAFAASRPLISAARRPRGGATGSREILAR